MSKLNLLRHTLILLILFGAAACSVPTGNIDAGTAAAGDNLWTVPKRVAYDINDTFRRNADLSVYMSYRGQVETVSISEVDISIIEDPDGAPDTSVPVPKDKEYLLTTDGRKLIVVNYHDMETWYSIEVGDPYKIGNSNNGSSGNNGNNGGSGGSGIIIEWK